MPTCRTLCVPHFIPFHEFLPEGAIFDLLAHLVVVEAVPECRRAGQILRIAR